MLEKKFNQNTFIYFDRNRHYVHFTKMKNDFIKHSTFSDLLILLNLRSAEPSNNLGIPFFLNYCKLRLVTPEAPPWLQKIFEFMNPRTLENALPRSISYYKR